MKWIRDKGKSLTIYSRPSHRGLVDEDEMEEYIRVCNDKRDKVVIGVLDDDLEDF